MIKTYTDIEQSKKLAEILPLESADMLWEQHGVEPYVTIKPWTTIGKSIGCHCLSCWSIAALLYVLPEGTRLLKSTNISSVGDTKYHCDCPKVNIDEWFDNPIDTCVEMIVHLHELNLL